MNILDFDNWSDAVKEGIDTNISSDDKDSKNEITIDNTTYTIKKNKISTNNVEISDNKLKTDIKNANRAIGDLKETEERFEELRLTGGEDTIIAEEVIDIINDEDYKKSDISLFDIIKTKCSDFFESSGKIVYINIPNLEDLFKTKIANKIKYIFNQYETGIGKGEYFLPLLFKDVHKKRPFGVDPYTKKRVKGDNYISNKNNIYDLELKSPNASLKFYEKNKPTKNTDIEKLKEIITERILQYAKTENKNGAYIMCIFEADKINETEVFDPKGMLFINISNINENSISDKIKNLINIVYRNKGEKVNKNEFIFTLTSNDNNPIINCVVHECYKQIEEKTEESNNASESLSTILSRDNFVNEYYTK
jgi:hypothetical protein